MIKTIPFESKHLVDLPPLLDCYEGDFDLPYRVAALYKVPGSFMWTLMENELPIAVVGAVVNGHIMTIWAAASVEVRHHGFGYHRAVLKLLNSFAKEQGIRRVQSIVNVDNEAAVKQHLAMGFEIEGKMRMSGPTLKDEYLFARIYDGR